MPYKIIRRMLKIAGAVLILLLVAIITALIFFDDFIDFREDDQHLVTFFREKHIPSTIGYYNSNGRKMRYLTIGNENAPVSILFIHGAPSSMSYFKPYFSNNTLLKQARMLSVDRPGYGYSGLGDPETSLEQQAKMIRPLLDSLRHVHHPLIIVAASYGTSVACRLAMDYPGLVDGLVLVAPSLAPGEERTFSIAYHVDDPLIKWAIPKMFITANAEKLSHRRELQKMLPLWKNIRVPVIYLQGTNDGLIYPSNAAFARRELVNAACLDIHMIPGRGHLIAFSELARIKNAILQMIPLSRNYNLARKTDRKQVANSSTSVSFVH